MLYFKEELIYWVENEIKLKGYIDDLKAFNYLEEINHILNHYFERNEYSPVYASDLDFRIRSEYPLVADIERALSNQTINVQQNNGTAVNNLPDDLNKLKIDKFGIFYTVLLKKGRVSALKDFLR